MAEWVNVCGGLCAYINTEDYPDLLCLEVELFGRWNIIDRDNHLVDSGDAPSVEAAKQAAIARTRQILQSALRELDQLDSPLPTLAEEETLP